MGVVKVIVVAVILRITAERIDPQGNSFGWNFTSLVIRNLFFRREYPPFPQKTTTAL